MREQKQFSNGLSKGIGNRDVIEQGDDQKDTGKVDGKKRIDLRVKWVIFFVIFFTFLSDTHKGAEREAEVEGP